MSMFMIQHGMGCSDYDALSVTASAVPLTVAKLSETINGRVQKAWKALIAIEGNAVRMRMDGVAPTAGVGFPMAVGTSILVEGPGNLANLQFIAQSGTATVHVLYFYKQF